VNDAPLARDLPGIQAQLDAWIKGHGRYWAPLSQFARLAEEVGELGRELNFRYGDKPRSSKDELASSADQSAAIADELGDVFFIVVLLANQLGLDLSRILAATLQKYEQRTAD
jgi:NTP pyrophosphatase (non-canonical NTP hydrolase)